MEHMLGKQYIPYEIRDLIISFLPYQYAKKYKGEHEHIDKTITNIGLKETRDKMDKVLGKIRFFHDKYSLLSEGGIDPKIRLLYRSKKKSWLRGIVLIDRCRNLDDEYIMGLLNIFGKYG